MYSLIVLLPLFAATLVGLFGRRLGDTASMWITTASVLASLGLSALVFWNIAVLGQPAVEETLYTWIATGKLTVTFGVLIDKLTAVMLIVVTGVSAMVHLYSMGYMHDDPSKPRFFAYLSLFTFMMLALVTAPNMVQMFLGWEGVGLASYLLIGFWHHKESANLAAMKAFIVNRVADVGLVLALVTTFAVFGTLQYSDIFASVDTVKAGTYTFLGHNVPVLELIALFLLIGAMGKSAQFGFHTWLPDAMEGPTPVSALIHAATMVTAGVFLLARMSPVFEQADQVLWLVGMVGGVTALFAATIGLTQTDIKRVIAYSTCSQLGYMFFACGVSAYSAAMFHLMTHAFFKALLFLGAGSVIHGMHGEQDMFKMGGLRKLLPWTYGLMWIGSLALAGVWPFAGFFSKDFILEAAWMSATPMGQTLYIVGTVAALLTAFYSFRVLYLTFHGHPHDHHAAEHAHESPKIMMIPMVVLAVGAVFAGLLGTPMMETAWWNGAIKILEDVHPGVVHAHHIPFVLKWLPLVVGLVGIAAATWFYVRRPGLPKQLAQTIDPLYSWSLNKWYIDELYDLAVVRPTRWLGTFFWKAGDEGTIDRFGPNGFGFAAQLGGGLLRTLQTGYVYHYAFVLILGVLGLISWMIVK